MKALLLVVLLALPARAGSPGAEAFDFLLFDGGARASAMGGAYTALAADPDAAFYNPAGYGLVRRHEAVLMHNEHVEGLRQEYVGLALRQGIGFHLNYLSYGDDIQRTTISQPDGAGTFGAHDVALGAGYGRSFGPLAVGAAAKYLSQSIDDVAARGWAADAGVLYRHPSGLRLGAALLNAGPEVRFQHAKEKLPTVGRAGAAYTLRDVTLALDVSKTRTDEPRAGVGVETVLLKALALRAGWTTRRDAGIGVSAGLGWRASGWSVDYAFAALGDAGLTHRLSLSLRWGEEKVLGDRIPRKRWLLSRR